VKQQHEELKQQLVNESNTRLIAEREELQQQHEELKQQLVNESNTRLSAEREELKQQLVNESNTQLSAESNDLQQQQQQRLEEQELKCKTKESDLSSLQGTFNKLQETNKELQNNVDANKTHVNELENQLRVCKEENTKVYQELQEMKQQLKIVQQSNQQLELTNEQCLDKTRSLKKENLQLKDQIKLLTQELETCKQEKKGSHAEILTIHRDDDVQHLDRDLDLDLDRDRDRDVKSYIPIPIPVVPKEPINVSVPDELENLEEADKASEIVRSNLKIVHKYVQKAYDKKVKNLSGSYKQQTGGVPVTAIKSNSASVVNDNNRLTGILNKHIARLTLRVVEPIFKHINIIPSSIQTDLNTSKSINHDSIIDYNESHVKEINKRLKQANEKLIKYLYLELLSFENDEEINEWIRVIDVAKTNQQLFMMISNVYHFLKDNIDIDSIERYRDNFQTLYNKLITILDTGDKAILDNYFTTPKPLTVTPNDRKNKNLITIFLEKSNLPEYSRNVYRKQTLRPTTTSHLKQTGTLQIPPNTMESSRASRPGTQQFYQNIEHNGLSVKSDENMISNAFKIVTHKLI
jgi:hypothetical protein